MKRLLFLFALVFFPSSSSPLTFYEPSSLYPSISFHNISIPDRHLYLNPSASSIPCGYMIPTELDLLRFPSPSGIVPEIITPGGSQELNLNNCTIMIVRLLFGAYEIFSPRARRYFKLSPDDSHGNTLCYLLITDSLTIQNPIISPHIFASFSHHPSSSFGYSPWHVFVLKKLIYSNPAKTMKTIKLSLFRLFPSVKFILYYDLKFQMNGNPIQFLEICDELMKINHVRYAIYRHQSQQRNIEDEFIGARERLEFIQKTARVVQNLTEEMSDIHRQFQQYEAEGFFDLMRTQSHAVPVDSAILVFKPQQHHQQQQEEEEHREQEQQDRLFCAWMNEVILYSRRDQLSYPYVEHRLNITGYKIPSTLLLRFFQKIPHKYLPSSSERREKGAG
jgi:hypothetical protein